MAAPQARQDRSPALAAAMKATAELLLVGLERVEARERAAAQEAARGAVDAGGQQVENVSSLRRETDRSAGGGTRGTAP